MKGCEMCDPGDGTIFPYYGVAPHVCFYMIPGATVGQSQELPESEWPDNFRVDPETEGNGPGLRCGVYTHCPDCGAGEKP